LLKKELAEYNYLSENSQENESLYPSLDDPNFIVKIAEKKEFNDTKYDGDIYQDIQKRADMLSNAEFELAPHQLFVKNFLSSQTPYNSLLLYHQLGTGKTCSAIGICEEMRSYLKQVGIQKRIIIVASPNVQDNFRLQLFDPRKLKLVDGLWNIRACTGNNLIKDINPMNMKNMSKEKLLPFLQHAFFVHEKEFYGGKDAIWYRTDIGTPDHHFGIMDGEIHIHAHYTRPFSIDFLKLNNGKACLGKCSKWREITIGYKAYREYGNLQVLDTLYHEMAHLAGYFHHGQAFWEEGKRTGFSKNLDNWLEKEPEC
jgi:hypothetical protein